MVESTKNTEETIEDKAKTATKASKGTTKSNIVGTLGAVGARTVDPDPSDSNPNIAKADYYLNDQMEVVGENDPTQAFLLISKGQRIPAHYIKKYGFENGEIKLKSSKKEKSEDK